MLRRKIINYIKKNKIKLSLAGYSMSRDFFLKVFLVNVLAVFYSSDTESSFCEILPNFT